MAQYYFAIAALPQLFFDSEAFPSSVELMAFCREHVNAREIGFLERAAKALADDIQDDNLHTLDDFRLWLKWDLSLRSDLAVLRAQALGWEIEQYQETHRELGTFEIAREAMMQASPHEGEEIIDRARWKYLDELEVGHYFDIEKLLIYLLKVAILERRSQFTQDGGTASFQETYNEIAGDLEEALEIAQ